MGKMAPEYWAGGGCIRTSVAPAAIRKRAPKLQTQLRDCDQLANPMAVSLGSPHARGVHRLLDLGIRCRRTDSCALVEVQDCRIPGKTEEGQELLTRLLRVRDDVLIPNCHHLQREYGVPVLHEAVVLRVVAAQRIQSTRECVGRSRKVLEVARQAGIYRVSDSVNYPRLRRQDRRQPEVHEVVGQLVDDQRQLRGSTETLHARLRQLLNERFAQLWDQLRVAAITVYIVTQPLGYRGKVVELTRPVNVGMSIEDLLDQRCP